MERANHWSDENTQALIQGVTGVAGQLIQQKKSGGSLSAQENAVASLSEQTLKALALYDSQNSQAVQQQQSQPKSNNTKTMLFIVGGILLVVIAFFLFKRK